MFAGDISLPHLSLRMPILAVLILLLLVGVLSSGPDVISATQWSDFLSQSDPINTFAITDPMSMPDVWLESSFAGNGMIGIQVMVCPGGLCRQSLLLGSTTHPPSQAAPHQAVIAIGRADISDIRIGSESKVCTEWHGKVTCAGDAFFAQAKLGVGNLVLEGSRGGIVSGTIRTHLHNATISARFVTSTGGVITFCVYVHAERQLLVVEGISSNGGEEGNATLQWNFQPAPALPPGVFGEIRPNPPTQPFTQFTGALPPPTYKVNPPAQCTSSASGGSCRQTLLVSPEGRGWVTAWHLEGPGRILVVVTSDIPVRASVPYPKPTRATEEASAALAAAAALTPSALRAEHITWWSNYYWSSTSGSFVSLPAAAAKVEQFHWIQVFKIGTENACRRFLDSGWTSHNSTDGGGGTADTKKTDPGHAFLDNCLMMDGMSGPFLVSKFKYPFAIWDMNVEGVQWASLSANHVEQAMALARRVPEQLPNMIASVPPELRNDSASIALSTASFSFLAQCAIDTCSEFPLCSSNYSSIPDLPCLTRSHVTKRGLELYFGGLPWICHSIWLVYRHTLDASILQELVPLLKRATTLYIRTAVRGADGLLHLPMMYSPEYANAPDTNFDHALFRWCLRTSIHIATELLPPSSESPASPPSGSSIPSSTSTATITATDVTLWQKVLAELSPPQVDPVTGSLMIGDGVSLTSPNKHFSHLFSIFPLGLLDWYVHSERELWIKSLGVFKYWNDPPGQSREGFTYLGMSLMTALTKPSLPGGAPPDWADHALGNITDHFFTVPQLGAGTMYADHAACGPVAGCRAGMAGACNESPLMASLALQHMLLQSWNGKPIAILPSIPPSWADARFAKMRAEGAVLVSAVRSNYTTLWFSLNATKGGNVSVHSTILDLASTNRGIAINPHNDGGGSGGLFGIFDISIVGSDSIIGSHMRTQPWAAVFYSRARGPPSTAEIALATTPLPAAARNIWGSRDGSRPAHSPLGPSNWRVSEYV